MAEPSTNPEPEIIEPKTEETAAPEPTAYDTRRDELTLRKTELKEFTTTTMQDPVAYAQMKSIARDMIAGGATAPDAKNAEQLLVKLQAGWEMGMKPIESSNSLYIVNGRVTIWGSALIRQLRKHGWSVEFIDESPESCTIRATHRKLVSRDQDDEVIEDTFKFADAEASGYTRDATGRLKVGWREGQNRKLKMRYGAAAQLAKTYLPEVLGSIAGVAEIDQDAPLMVEGEIVGDAGYASRISNATTRVELLDVISSLPVSQRKEAIPLADERMKELTS